MALHHAQAAEKIRLSSVAESSAKTSALVKTNAFEAVHLALRAGTDIANHSVPGHATIHCLEGRVILGTAEPLELVAGDWLYLDPGQEHSVLALDDSSLLVTILFSQDH